MQTRFFYYDEDTSIIFHSELDPVEIDRNDLIHIGSTENPNYKMAAAGFTQKFKIKSGWKIRNYDA